MVVGRSKWSPKPASGPLAIRAGAVASPFGSLPRASSLTLAAFAGVVEPGGLLGGRPPGFEAGNVGTAEMPLLVRFQYAVISKSPHNVPPLRADRVAVLAPGRLLSCCVRPGCRETFLAEGGGWAGGMRAQRLSPGRGSAEPFSFIIWL